MRNPIRSEAEAFRFLLVVVAGAIAIAVGAAGRTWLGVAAAVPAVAGIAVWLRG